MSDQDQGAKGASGGVSFGFAKLSRPKAVNVSNAAFGESGAEKKVEVDYVKGVIEDGKIQGTIERTKKEELIIPCKGNDIQFKAKPQVTVKQEESKNENGESLEALAAKELMEDTEKWNEVKETGDEEFKGPQEIPLSEDLAKRADPSTIEDYESIPVEGFGMAMLKGMGFKPGEGIGGFKKLDVKCIDPVLRPKGLGLGASRPNAQSGKDGKTSKTDDGEELVLKRNCYVCITSGTSKDLYGQVEGMDEDSARVFVKMAVGGKIVSISENAVRVVSKSEYKKYSKVINKDLFEKYEEKQVKREMEWDEAKRKRSRSRSRSRDRDSSGKKMKSSKNGSDVSSSTSSASYSRKKSSWIRPYLRVRFIDDRYKKGRYFNSKVVIEDVVSFDLCTCRTEEGRLLEDIKAKQLETLIPKREGSIVMIVGGERARGRLAELLDKNKSTCRAAVALLPDKDEILRLHFDDICEYSGEIMDD